MKANEWNLGGSRMITLAAAAVAALAIVGAPAMAQHGDDYETGYVGDADGEPITGQQGYYIPVAESNDGLVFTYAGNTIGVADNPSGGGAYFVGSVGGDVPDPDGQPFARSQKDVSFDPPFGGKDLVKMSYDLYVTKIGDTVTNQNVGSFSTQTVAGGAVFGQIDLVTWVDINDTNMGWTGAMVWFNAAGTQVQENITEFANLAINKWYRRSSTLDLVTNAITEISVTDLDTNVTTTVVPVDRYAPAVRTTPRPRSASATSRDAPPARAPAATRSRGTTS